MSDYGAFEHHVMPSGAECWYRDSDHSYYSEVQAKGGNWTGVAATRLPSPSAIGGVLDIDKAQRLMAWAARHPDALGYRDKRADEGTHVHVDVLEALASGDRIPSLADVDDDARGMAQGVLAWWNRRRPQPIGSELVVYSPHHGYAGRLDLLALVDGKRTIVDLKTSKFIGEGAHTQLAGYVLAAVEADYGPIEAAVILQVRSDGTFTELPCAAEASDFLAALDAYRAAKRVKKLAASVQKEALAA